MAKREPARRPGDGTSWLLLIHRIPARPNYLRVKFRRRLRELGAAALKNSVYVLRVSPAARAKLAELAQQILRAGGEALVCESRIVEGLTDGAVEDLMRDASDAEYSAIAREARRLASALRRGRAPREPERRRSARALERLRARLDRTIARDSFGAGGRTAASGAVALAEDLAQGVEEAAARPGPPVAPRGFTWVTRSGVMVDRIASAWLIRRFIDASARFKFVDGRGYRPGPGELLFDMAGADFTHRDGRCTFEVLLEHFHLRDSALRPIGEIVHDLDLEDRRYDRPEAAGVDRMITGLAIAKHGDEQRLSQGGAVFDTLYESFRRPSHRVPRGAD